MSYIDEVIQEIQEDDNKYNSLISYIKQQNKSDFFYFVHDFLDIKSIETGRKIIHHNPHQEVCNALTKIGSPYEEIRRDAQHTMILLPREFGKTFLVECFMVWYIIHNPNKSILLFSSNTEKARDILQATRLIINTHPWIQSVYGDILSKNFNNRNLLTLSTRSVTTKEKNIQAFGVENSLQGYHVDLTIFEDVISHTYCTSPKEKTMIDNVFFNVARPLLKKQGHMIYVGTRYAHDDIPGQIINSPKKRRSWYIISKSIENEFGNAAYPHIVNDKQLEKIRNEVESNAFYSSQYLNSPKNEMDSVFSIENYKKYMYQELPPIDRAVMGVDLATSISGKGDDRALVIVGVDKEGVIYIIDSYHTNKMTLDRFYHKIKDYYLKYKDKGIIIEKVVIEINNNEPLLQQYRTATMEDGSRIPFIPIRHTGSNNKELRIQTLERPLEMGYLRIPENYKNHKSLREMVDKQLEYFNPLAKNRDDIIDALEMAYSECSKITKISKSTIETVDNRIYHGDIW